jgi:hypothetical protein
MTTSQQIPPRGTKEFTKYAISVMMAHYRGEEVACAHKFRGNFHPIKEPAWDWASCDYRIKPKPTVVPWTFNTCPVGKVVTHTAAGYRALIVAACQSHADIGQDGERSYDDLLSLYNIDGSPCGTVQQ